MPPPLILEHELIYYNPPNFPELTLAQLSTKFMKSNVLSSISPLSVPLFCIIFFMVQFMEIRELGRIYEIDNSENPLYLAEEDYFQCMILLCTIITTHIEIGQKNPTEHKHWKHIYLHTLGIS